MQGARRILADIGLVEIEQHIGGELDADLGRGLLEVQCLGLAGHLDRLATEIDNREPQILDREVEIGHSGNKIDNSDVEVGGGPVTSLGVCARALPQYVASASNAAAISDPR